MLATKRACSVDDCEGVSRSAGMCVKHYTRWLRHGDVRALKRLPCLTRPCEQCGDPMSVKPSMAHRRRFCSRRCVGMWSTAHQQRPTGIERRMAEALASAGVHYEMHVGIGRFVVDFLLDACVVVEADGDYWHSLPQNIARDAAKDAFLRDAGYKVWRFTESEITADAPACVARITDAVHEQPFLAFLPPARTCEIAGCTRSHKARGLCGAHYLRWRKYGDPLAGGPARRGASSSG